MQLKWLIGMVIIISAGGVAAQCNPPVPPQLEIDGAQERRTEMVSAKQALQVYVAQAENYLSCLDRMTTIAMARGKDTGAGRDKRIAAYNKVMAEMNEAVTGFRHEAAQFNGR